jgi:predicted metal-binding membrane protein
MMSTIALRREGRSDGEIVLAVLAVCAAAWAVTADRMAGMDAGPASALGPIGWFTLTWLVMMAAMMLPAVAPMVVVYGRRARSRSALVAFTVGYLAAWLLAGLLAYAAIDSVRAAGPGFLRWDDGGRFVCAAVIAGAGAYQLCRPKRAFLRRCCDRVAFVDQHSRPGVPGALRIGVEHGRDCVGASWALMAALFAIGVMSLPWMVVLAVLIAAERLLPRATRPAIAVVFVVLAIGVALVPTRVPALTVPQATPPTPMEMADLSEGTR